MSKTAAEQLSYIFDAQDQTVFVVDEVTGKCAGFTTCDEQGRYHAYVFVSLWKALRMIANGWSPLSTSFRPFPRVRLELIQHIRAKLAHDAVCDTIERF